MLLDKLHPILDVDVQVWVREPNRRLGQVLLTYFNDFLQGQPGRG